MANEWTEQRARLESVSRNPPSADDWWQWEAAIRAALQRADRAEALITALEALRDRWRVFDTHLADTWNHASKACASELDRTLSAHGDPQAAGPERAAAGLLTHWAVPGEDRTYCGAPLSTRQAGNATCATDTTCIRCVKNAYQDVENRLYILETTPHLHHVAEDAAAPDAPEPVHWRDANASVAVCGYSEIGGATEDYSRVTCVKCRTHPTRGPDAATAAPNPDAAPDGGDLQALVAHWRRSDHSVAGTALHRLLTALVAETERLVAEVAALRTQESVPVHHIPVRLTPIGGGPFEGSYPGNGCDYCSKITPCHLFDVRMFTGGKFEHICSVAVKLCPPCIERLRPGRDLPSDWPSGDEKEPKS